MEIKNSGYTKNYIQRQLKDIAGMLPEMIPYTDTSVLSGEEIKLSGLRYEGDLEDEKLYRVKFTHYRMPNHLRQLKRIWKNTKNEKQRGANIEEYVRKNMILEYNPFKS